MNLINSIQSRCSTRKFLSKPVEDVSLRTILEAARMAPSGKNQRGNKIYVFQGEEVLRAFNQSLIEAVRNGRAEGVDGLSSLVEKEDYSFCFHAPIFLLVTSIADPYNAYVNCGCLLENAMLQATELGIGTCFINIARRAENDGGFRTFLESMGVGEGEVITGGLAIGYPEQPFTNNRKTQGNEIVWVGKTIEI